MIKALEKAIERIKSLPEDRQRYAAELLEDVASGEETYRLSDEERRLIREGLAELERSEIATEAEVRAVFDKYRQ